MNKKTGLKLVALIGGLAISACAIAGPIQVYVGYADGVRGGAFFPSPYETADIFQGNVGSVDTGAIRIHNSGPTSLTLNDLDVKINPMGGGFDFHMWSFGAGLTLGAGQDAVFASTANYNFDSSDFPALVVASLIDNCSIGASAATANCIDNAPLVNITVDGVLTAMKDTGHVLDTGGFDYAAFGNESLQWRLIGTTGVDDPGGTRAVPLPPTIALLAIGLLAMRARRQK